MSSERGFLAIFECHFSGLFLFSLIRKSGYGVLAFLVSLTFLCFLARDHLNQKVYPFGDLAADMLLADLIESSGHMLTGHYSRFEFNHPGPFFFYANYVVDAGFSPLLIGRYNTWVLSVLLLNSLFIGISAFLVTRVQVQGIRHQWIAPLIFTFFILLILKDKAITWWMPWRLVLPYLAFLLTLPYIIQRRFEYLPLAVLLACIVIHGYVLLPFFTLPLLFVGILTGLLYRPHWPNQKEWTCFFISALVAIAFILPILIDVFVNEPSNLDKILKASRMIGRAKHPSWSESFEFMKHFWKRFLVWPWPYWFLGILAGTIILLKGDRGTKRDFLLMIGVCLFVTGFFVWFFTNVRKPLEHFTGYYYSAVPIVLCAFAIANGARITPPMCFKSLVGQRITAVLISACVFIGILHYSAYARLVPSTNPDIHKISKAIIHHTSRFGEARIDYHYSALFYRRS